jgi:hypothetical protein
MTINWSSALRSNSSILKAPVDVAARGTIIKSYLRSLPFDCPAKAGLPAASFVSSGE